MGCDIFYHCDTSNREQVTKLVHLLCRYAQDNEISYKVVSLPNKQLLVPEGKKAVKVDLYGFIFANLWEEPPGKNAEWNSRCQFVFDFLRGGRLIRLVLPALELYQSRDEKVPCLLMKEGGYWRSIGYSYILPRFLALCKVRYLPNLWFSSDYGEASYFQRKICENERIRKRLVDLTESAFYHQIVDRLGVVA